MIRSLACLLLQICCLILPNHVLATAPNSVHYNVEIVQGSSARLKVEMQFLAKPDEGQVQLQIPEWAPGDYHLQDFAKYIRNVVANTQSGEALPVVQSDNDTWTVHINQQEIVHLGYDVLSEPAGIFSPNVRFRTNQVFWNGPAVYLYIVNEKNNNVSLHIAAPAGWIAATPLARRSNGDFYANNYDDLADSPALAAQRDAIIEQDFTAFGVVHRVLFFGHIQNLGNITPYVQALNKIVVVENQIMGVTPYPRYIFFFDVEGGGGGLEHHDSARLVFWPGMSIKSFGAFAGHEFFHLWNVKRIRPLLLGPFDYIHPPHTRSLWFAEGITDYYAWRALLLARLISPEEYIAHWKEQIQALQSDPARLRISAEESSYRVWDSGNSEGYGGLSYYLKGSLIGLCLDLTLRQETNGRRSLDDLMKLLYKKYSPPHPGYTADELRAAYSEVAGVDMDNFYDQTARAPGELPFAKSLSYVGLDMNFQPLQDSTRIQRTLLSEWLDNQN